MTPRTVGAGVLALLSAGLALAGPLPLSWSVRSPTNTVARPDGVTGGFSFPNTVFEPGGWDAPVVVSTVASYSIAGGETPDRVSDLPYRFAVELRDDTSGETAQFTFGGQLSGTLWRTGSSLSNRFTGPTSRSAELGGHTYVIALDRFTPPGGYGDPAAGTITARVSLEESSVEPPVGGVVGTPEPGTIVLGGVAAAGGFAVLRRRRTTA